jgi:hypothetical protein
MNPARASRSTAAVVAATGVLMLAVMGRAVAGLVVAWGIAYLLSLRPIPTVQLRAAIPAYLAAFGGQIAHLVEENRTGFYRAFPPLLGERAWSNHEFVLFNLAWLLVFGVGVFGLMRGWRLAIAIALFLALGGGILNGLAHVVLAASIGGYFPGLYTAPLVFAAGCALALRLLRPAPVVVSVN